MVREFPYELTPWMATWEVVSPCDRRPLAVHGSGKLVYMIGGRAGIEVKGVRSWDRSSGGGAGIGQGGRVM